MTRSKQRLEDKQLVNNEDIRRTKLSYKSCFSGGAGDPEGRRQVHHGDRTVSSGKWKVVKGKRVSDELAATCSSTAG